MALSFSPAQIKTMSGDLLRLPDKLNNPATGLYVQKANYAALGPALLATDSNQKVFSDNWIAAIGHYHQELALLNGVVRSNYVDSKITDAAKGIKGPGTHYPTDPPAWINLAPKAIDLSLGLPTSASTGTIESDLVTGFAASLLMITTGFNDGSTSFTGNLAAGVITLTQALTGVSVGNRLLINVGSTVIFGTVTAINSSTSNAVPPVTTTTVSVSGTGSASGSASAQNFFPGFSNAQRSGTASTGSYENAYVFLRDQFKAQVAVWASNLALQLAAVTPNEDYTKTAQITAAKNNISLATASITTWQGLTDRVANGLLTDSGIAGLQSAITARGAQIPARVSEILSALGTITQAADGSFTGSGVYFNLFKLVDIRAGVGTGTLTQYYDNQRNQGFFDKQISAVLTQIAQYQDILIASAVVADTVAGQDVFGLDSATGLIVGASVSVMDDTSVIYSRTVSQINGTNVRLNSGIPIVLTKANLARIVMLK